MQLSARNQIPARVTSINAGEAIANVELAANGVRLVASITVEAVRQLGLAEGSNVTCCRTGGGHRVNGRCPGVLVGWSLGAG
jgi:molybdopterin-binding protein